MYEEEHQCMYAEGEMECHFVSFALLSPSSGTGEPFRRAGGQRWEEQRAPWRVSQGPLPPRPTAPGPPPPPPPLALPSLPAPQLVAVVVSLALLLLLLLPLLLVVVIVVAAAVVVVTQAVLPVVVLQQEDRQCLRYLFTVGYLTDKQCRWVHWCCAVLCVRRSNHTRIQMLRS